MALGVLNIIFCLAVLLSIASILLITFKNGALLNKLWIFVLIVMYSLILSFMNFTSAPSNYLIYKVVSVIFALCAVSALGLKSLKSSNILYSKILLIVSILGSTIQLLFF